MNSNCIKIDNNYTEIFYNIDSKPSPVDIPVNTIVVIPAFFTILSKSVPIKILIVCFVINISSSFLSTARDISFFCRHM